MKGFGAIIGLFILLALFSAIFGPHESSTPSLDAGSAASKIAYTKDGKNFISKERLNENVRLGESASDYELVQVPINTQLADTSRSSSTIFDQDKQTNQAQENRVQKLNQIIYGGSDKVEPGPVTVKLEDGYEASFVLAESFDKYKIWSDSRSSGKGPAFEEVDWRASAWDHKYSLIIDGVMDIYIYRGLIMPDFINLSDQYKEYRTVDRNMAYIDPHSDCEFIYFPGEKTQVPGGWTTPIMVSVFACRTGKHIPIIDQVIETMHISGPELV
ncbi:MAG: hypothetical protein MUO26_10015 [Methanotrichaceae archaeon]|nr:hypothetical protein [Methanotrichaceae archaeon]